MARLDKLRGGLGPFTPTPDPIPVHGIQHPSATTPERILTIEERPVDGLPGAKVLKAHGANTVEEANALLAQETKIKGIGEKTREAFQGAQDVSGNTILKQAREIEDLKKQLAIQDKQLQELLAWKAKILKAIE